MLFRQESNFIYLTGFDHPGAIVVVATGSRVAGLDEGDAWLFVPHGNAVWQGRTETLEDFKERYDVTDVFCNRLRSPQGSRT
jgi:Xaa-Pro aminopeptidase